MPKLELRFEKNVLGEYAVAIGRPVTIGRAPDNDIVIDNLAVSTLHARVMQMDEHYMVEDQQSLNGTFVNNRRVQQRTVLRDQDAISIGKHTIVFFEFAEATMAAKIPQANKPFAPKIDETFVLETKKRVELLKHPAEATQVSRRVVVAHLKVLDGKTDHPEYVLTSKLTVIGKSDMASIRLRGWFKPKTSAVITRKDEGYNVGPATEKPTVKVNGLPVKGHQALSDGDVVEISGVRFLFSMPAH